jgi:putative FmdB family regulatory protein
MPAMPIYEYRCEACDHEFDELQKLSDAPLRDCPRCGKPKLIKKVSAAGFQLKGTGWYATDFRKKAEPAKAEAPAKAETKAEAKAEPKSEKKPEPKPAKKPDAS